MAPYVNGPQGGVAAPVMPGSYLPVVLNGVTYYNPAANIPHPMAQMQVPAPTPYYAQPVHVTIPNEPTQVNADNTPTMSPGYQSPAPVMYAPANCNQAPEYIPTQPMAIPVPPTGQFITTTFYTPPSHTVGQFSTPPMGHYQQVPLGGSPLSVSQRASPASAASPGLAAAMTPHVFTPRSGSPASNSSGSSSAHERSLSTKLEVVWHGQFDAHFQSYLPHRWSLHPIEDPYSVEYDGIKKYMDSAKVRFICPNCSNCWTSMKGRVYFMFILDEETSEGFVYFRLIGQKCSKCPDKDFVHALWYPDEIAKVISNVHQKVGQVYYGVTTPIVRVDRRRGQPKRPHILAACQACEMGICKEEHNYR